jgi:hypothetical protein
MEKKADIDDHFHKKGKNVKGKDVRIQLTTDNKELLGVRTGLQTYSEKPREERDAADVRPVRREKKVEEVVEEKKEEVVAEEETSEQKPREERPREERGDRPRGDRPRGRGGRGRGEGRGGRGGRGGDRQ